MKRLSAIVLSLLLFWVQVVVMAPSATAKAAKGCCGCACPKADCCVTRSAPDSLPLPPATVQTGAPNLNSFFLTASVAWMLPCAEADLSSAHLPSPFFAARVPLFQRDCALLI